MTETTKNSTTPESPGTLAGIVARFETPETLITASRAVRDAGFRRWDAHSPMPVHGLDEAMGIRLTILPFIVLVAGLTGGAVGLLMQWYTNAVDYPQIISGKPLFSLPANIPVVFELVVLFSALTTFAGALLLSGLPQWFHGLFANRAFHRVTSDAFFISIDARDAKFHENEVRRLLESQGAVSIDSYYDPIKERQIPTLIYWAVAILVVLAPIPVLLIAWAREVPSSRPRLTLFMDMDVQPKYKAQNESPLFVDNREERPQVPGSVPRGRLDNDTKFVYGKEGDNWVRTFPESVPVNLETMQRGRERFTIYCAPCHGQSGDGDGLVSARASQRMEANWVPPVQLYATAVRFQPVGQLFGTISNGVRKMPAYGSQIPPADRWAIVLYLQALQRSQSGTVDDLPEEVRKKIAAH